MRRWVLMAAVVLATAMVAGGLMTQARGPRRPDGDRSCLAAIGLILLDGEAGLYVLGVTDGSLADSAGIRPGDVLTAALDTPLATAAQLEALIARSNPEVPLSVTVARQGQMMTVALSLE